MSSLNGRIADVSIAGFRSLRDLRDLTLGNLELMIGPNGAGKSNLMSFFEMLSWVLKGKGLQSWVVEHGFGDDQLFMGASVTPRLDASITIETEAGRNEYRLGLAHVTPDTLAFVDEAYRYSAFDREGESEWTPLGGPSNESQLLQTYQGGDSNKTLSVIVNLLRNVATFQFHDTSSRASFNLAWDVTENTSLRSDGGNLAPILLRLREEDPHRYKQIIRQIQRILPSFEDFVLEPTGGKVQLRWKAADHDKRFGPHLTSDGSLRTFALMTLLNLPDAMLPDVLFIDEPELGLHPHAIILVSEMVKKLSQRRQVILATQSPYFVDCFDLGDTLVTDLSGPETRFRRLSEESYRQWLEEDYRLSDVWLRELAGAPLE